MKIDLMEAIFYGEWCSEKKEKYIINNWLEKSSLQFFSTDQLINEFGYRDCDAIESSEYFVPVFKTDTIVLKTEFVASLHLKDIADEIQTIMEYNKCSNGDRYGVAFDMFCEEHKNIENAYYAYERNQLLQDAEKWCKENKIPYYTPNDPERKLNLRDISLYGYGGEVLLEETGGKNPVSYWLCKKDFSVIGLDDDVVPDGYKSNEDDISSMFVPLLKANRKQYEEAFISNFHDEKVEEKITLLMYENKNFSYEDAFWVLIENTPELSVVWMRYKEEQFLKEAEQWAQKNHIPYYIPKNRPDHLGPCYQSGNSFVLDSDTNQHQSGDGSMIDHDKH